MLSEEAKKSFIKTFPEYDINKILPSTIRINLINAPENYYYLDDSDQYYYLTYYPEFFKWEKEIVTNSMQHILGFVSKSQYTESLFLRELKKKEYDDDMKILQEKMGFDDEF